MTESRRPSDGTAAAAKIIEIAMERPGGHYNAGDTVVGNVILHLPRPIRIKGIEVQVYGGTRVTWDEETSYFKGFSVKTEHKNVDLFLQDTIKIDVDPNKTKTDSENNLPKPSDGLLGTPAATPQSCRRMSIWDVMCAPVGTREPAGHVIPAGVHHYNFRLALPYRLPSSYRGRWGSIQYSVKAHLERNGKSTIENEIEFTVMDVIDLNNTPELARPIAGSETFQQTGWCCAMGSISVGVRVARKGYAQGDNIPFHVELTNHSRIKARDPRVALVQHVSFRTHQGVRKLTNMLATVSKQGINPGATCIWDKDRLAVPQDAIPTCVHLKAIQVKYTLSVLLSGGFSIPINITIATKSYRRDTLIKFYNQVGLSTNYSSSPSLRSSRISIAPPCDRSPVARLRKEHETTPSRRVTPKSSRKSSLVSLGNDGKPFTHLTRANRSRGSITEEVHTDATTSKNNSKPCSSTGLPEITVVNY